VIQLHCGNSLDVIATLGDDSVDSIVTDPPYGLSFMGRKWDYDVPSVDIWVECLRVLKPGGHLLAFAGTRTQHRMAVNIEDAGFEIRDMIAWVYGSGMPKSHNLKRGRVCECGENPLPYTHGEQETEHDLSALRQADLQAAEPAGKACNSGVFTQLQQQAQGASAPIHARGDSEAIRKDDGGEQPLMARGTLCGAEQGLRDGQDAQPSEGKAQRLRVGAHFGGGANAGEELDIGRGGASHQPRPIRQQAGEPEDLCQPSGALDGGALRGRGQCSRCGGLRKEWEGFGTSLKPSLEPLTVARKPLSERTVAANVLEHGTGAINIDGCRVGAEDLAVLQKNWDRVQSAKQGIASQGIKAIDLRDRAPSGRWPANLIHDGSDEVTELFPHTTSGVPGVRRKVHDTNAMAGRLGLTGEVEAGYGDNGSAARFFYVPKCNKKDRDGSIHPTMKPTDLMAYLVRLVTPPGGVVLDPFMGSGSTGKAAVREGFDFIGIEREEEYVAIASKRLQVIQRSILASRSADQNG
jgi:hypothetical protein